MKAVGYTRYGIPDDLEVKEIEKPAPSQGQVLVRVKAASINSWDWDKVKGILFYWTLSTGHCRKENNY